MTRAADDGRAARTGRRRSSRLGDALLVAASIVISIVVAEGVVRYLNGQPLFALRLTQAMELAAVKPDAV